MQKLKIQKLWKKKSSNPTEIPKVTPKVEISEVIPKVAPKVEKPEVIPKLAPKVEKLEAVSKVGQGPVIQYVCFDDDDNDDKTEKPKIILDPTKITKH